MELGRRSSIIRLSTLLAPGVVTGCAQNSTGAVTGNSFEEGITNLRQRYGVSKVWFRVERPNRPPVDVALGGASGRDSIPISSISKSVTSLAVGVLMQDGRLTLDDTLDKLLTDYFARWGQPLDPSLRPITVRRLLTHTAGLPTNASSDPVRGIRNDIVIPLVETRDHPFHYLMTANAARSDSRTDHVYSNISAILLSLIVEAVSGRPYADYCQQAVLRPQGIADAEIPPRWRVIGPFGGWFMTPESALKLWRAFDIYNPTILNRQTLQNLIIADLAPPIRAGAFIGDGSDVYYSMGAYIRKANNRRSYTLLHNGIGDIARYSPPTYYSLIQKTVPGSAWFITVSPVVNATARRTMISDINDIVEKTP